MKLSILDTDIISAFFRGNAKVTLKVEEHLNEYGFINISVITYYEVLSGLLYKDAQKQLVRFKEFADANKILLLTVTAVNIAAEIEADLRRKGTPIGHSDVLIAGISIANNMQLITNNTGHFSRIENIEIENWMALDV